MIEKIPAEVDSRFRFVLLAARRAEQLMRGAPPRVELGQAKPTRIAVEELALDRVPWSYGLPQAPVEVDDEEEQDDDLAAQSADEA